MKITNFSNHAYCLPSSHSFLPTKYLVAEAVGSLGQGSRSKLNCNLKSLHKMARSIRAASNHHPANPTSLEERLKQMIDDFDVLDYLKDVGNAI